MSDVERGAQEEESGVPLTETEVAASKRPPSQPDMDKGSSMEEGTADVRRPSQADEDMDEGA
jgi:hypothetical protein